MYFEDPLIVAFHTIFCTPWNHEKSIGTCEFQSKTLRDRKTLPRVYLLSCRGIKLFLAKDCFKFCQKLIFQNFSFWVLSIFEFEFCQCLNLTFFTIWVFFVVVAIWFFLGLSQFKFLSFVTIWVLSQFEFLSLFRTWVFEFSHNLGFVKI